MSDANIQIPVDLTNPGQFFACCGLLELADRLWPGTEGWFSGPTSFEVDRPASEVTGLLTSISKCDFQPLLPAEELDELRVLQKKKQELRSKGKTLSSEIERRRKHLNSKRIAAGFRLGPPFSIQVDWWLADESDGSHLATWAGPQAISETVADIQQSLPTVTIDELLEYECLIERQGVGKPRAPLSFDAGRVGTAQDIGFSADNVGQPIASCVWTEFLALVAIQRFCLKSDSDGYFQYGVWSKPLPVLAAAVVARGLAPQANAATGHFRLVGRDNEGRYKAFQQATLTEWKNL